MIDDREALVMMRALFQDGYERAHKKALAARTRASEARRALPPGSSRARVTTRNARWIAACEHFDRVEAAKRVLDQMIEAHEHERESTRKNTR